MEDLLSKMQELLSDPESMKQISELAQMLKSGEMDTPADLPPPEQNISGFDPKLLIKAGELLSRQEQDKTVIFLLALKPHLKQPRQEKVDKAVRLLKIWHIWKQMQEAGMLQNFI